MMYRVKNIHSDDVELSLPKCMYRIKNPIDFPKTDEINININQQAPNPQMAELEQRQDLLLKKLDILYDRIKVISSYCQLNNVHEHKVEVKKHSISTPDEIVLVANPGNLPWFLNILLAQSNFAVNVAWHIHSSVPNEKVPKIMAFVKSFKDAGNNADLKLRLIFKHVSADSELMLSSLAAPIVGNVNILRYLSYVYPSAVPYNDQDFLIDGLMDLCHALERTPEKSKEAIINKLFSNCNKWIYNNTFSIVDLAAYTVIKQWRNVPKSVPKVWLENCNKLCV